MMNKLSDVIFDGIVIKCRYNVVFRFDSCVQFFMAILLTNRTFISQRKLEIAILHLCQILSSNSKDECIYETENVCVRDGERTIM